MTQPPNHHLAQLNVARAQEDADVEGLAVAGDGGGRASSPVAIPASPAANDRCRSRERKM